MVKIRLAGQEGANKWGVRELTPIPCKCRCGCSLVTVQRPCIQCSVALCFSCAVAKHALVIPSCTSCRQLWLPGFMLQEVNELQATITAAIRAGELKKTQNIVSEFCQRFGCTMDQLLDEQARAAAGQSLARP